MYLISAYFDDKTEERIGKYMQYIARRSGNTWMLDAKVPPHMTIAAFHTKREDMIMERLNQEIPKLQAGMIQCVSVGAFFPYVLHILPVLNKDLNELSASINEIVLEVPDTKISSYYQPMQWMPHITLAKQLNKQEMQEAFAAMQEQFVPFSGKIIKIGIAKTNPYQELGMWDLNFV
jgi:2'-5' RNA ligase